MPNSVASSQHTLETTCKTDALRSPFRPYHVHRNPFGELDREQRSEVAVLDVQPWVEAISDPQKVVQFIGDCGNGKSTHLLAIHRAVPGSIYVYLPESGPQPKIPMHRPLLVDEAQRLSNWNLRRLLKSGGQLMLGTHVDLTLPIRRHGLLPMTFPVSSKTDAISILRILNRRIAFCAFGDVPPKQLTLEHSQWLHATFGTNVRAIEHFLYEEFQKCVHERSSWPPDIQKWNRIKKI